MAIECLVLGAGQQVGKSCVVATVGGKRIMFDCGMHMGYTDARSYPDFSRIPRTGAGGFDSAIACVVITHFHLDHIGALPYFTEVCGYNGPIYMTYPTKALAPLMLEDYRKVKEQRGDEEQFSCDHVKKCMKKVITVDIKQTVQVDKDIQIRAYYAGHVLGAAMFYAKVGDATMVYTGDYNMTPDRHLGAAQIDCLPLDLLVTESTYATTIRDSKYAREREFLKVVHKCVSGGGKVLIPAFALGRQELCILLDDYWERMNLKIPIYFSAVCSFKPAMINDPGPCVLFATPGMLTGGFSVEVFKQWAPSEKNLVTLPGYCLAGTLGHKLMSGKATTIDLDKDTKIEVRCQIHQLSFSPHTDAKGIMDLVGFLSPKHVILVHGEKPKMAILRGRIKSELGIDCAYPENGETVSIPAAQAVKIDVTKAFVRSHCNTNFHSIKDNSFDLSSSGSEDIGTELPATQDIGTAVEGVLVMEKTKRAKIMHKDELLQKLSLEENKVQFAYCCPVYTSSMEQTTHQSSGLGSISSTSCLAACSMARISDNSLSECPWLNWLLLKMREKIDCTGIKVASDHLSLGSLHIRFCPKNSCTHRIEEIINPEHAVFFCCSWSLKDEKLAWRVLTLMRDSS